MVKTEEPSRHPLVDVLIPTTGRASLAQAMLSALAQTYAYTRVVVAADANHAGAASIFDRVEALHRDGRASSLFMPTPRPFGRGDRVKEWWIRHPASSGLIRFLDDDDWMPPTAIRNMVQPMIEDPGVTLVVCYTLQIHHEDGCAFAYRMRTGRLQRGQVVANCALFRKWAAQGVRLESDPAKPRFWLHEIADKGRVVELKLPLYWYNATRLKKPNPVKRRG